MPHVIEVFTAGCPLCATEFEMVEVGKCASCVLVERNLAARDPDALRRAKEFDVRVVPTIVIDGKIKVEGRPNFPWICGDEFYAMLESRFPLSQSRVPEA